VDYDLLLEHPDGGTVALSWRADDATPWSVAYADHWAANYVLSVNDHAVTVQQVLLFLKLAGDEYPNLMTEVVDQTLIAQVMGESLPLVNGKERQAATDEFRNANHLCGADAMRRWLKDTGLSAARFEELVNRLIHRRKLEGRVTADRIQPCFEANRERYDTVRFFRVDTRHEAVAKRLIASARREGLLVATQTRLTNSEGRDLTGSLTSRYAFELPPKLANAAVGTVIGPIADGRAFWVAQVLERQPARLDAQTRAAISEQLFREWLAERRSQATVRWHWV
jgi:putative peptide maturation system protein